MKNLITCLTMCVLSGAIFAETWTVDDDGKADFDNIQAAVDAASDGDEIIVMPGTYTSTNYEVVRLEKGITLRSSDPSDATIVATTIIDGEDTRISIVCTNDTTISRLIDGFTITRGYTLGNGGGMFNTGGSVQIQNCVFAANTANEGGGMGNLAETIITIDNCTFSGNTANDYGGGGIWNNSCNPTITNCIFANNDALSTANGRYGGGGICNYQSSPLVTNCVFTGNSTPNTPFLTQGGGGMSNFLNSNPTITDCTFENNHSFDGGAVKITNSSPTFNLCDFDSNSSEQNGGAISNNDNSNSTFSNCDFIGNSAYSQGGAIFNTSNSNPSFLNCNFRGNTVQSGGGGAILSMESSNPTFENCEITGNICLHGQPIGGGIYITPNSSVTTLINTTVCNNSPDQINGDYTDGGGNTIADVCIDDEDGDGIDDLVDNCYLYNPDQADCNGNEVGDICDIADGTSSDWNGNEIPDECECLADIALDDGQVNVHDLLILIALWGTDSSTADINYDGIVNIEDLLLLIGAWGACP